MTLASSKDSSQRSQVSFDEQLTVRYYPTVLGDNPSVKEGPPVSIGWEFTTEKLSLAETPQSHKRIQDYHLDAPTRIERLVKNGVSQEEMDTAYAEIQLLQRLRRVNAAILRSSAAASTVASEVMASSFPSVESEIMEMEEFLSLEGKMPMMSDRRTPGRSRSNDVLFTTSSTSIPRSKSLPRRTRSSDLAMLSGSKTRDSVSRFQPLQRVNAAILRKASVFSKGACLKARRQKPMSAIPRAA